MRRAIWLSIAIVLPAVGVGSAAVIAPNGAERVVEGHSVFTVLEVGKSITTDTQRFAAAVAVLIREAVQVDDHGLFPGVLWFNDQFLVDSSGGAGVTVSYRYPCFGAAIAVPAGSLDPRSYLESYEPALELIGAPLTYLESYIITDPGDHVWTVDHWRLTPSSSAPPIPVWTSALLGGPTGSLPDGGENCPPLTAGDCQLADLLSTSGCQGVDPSDPRYQARMTYCEPRPARGLTIERCDNLVTGAREFLYNALIVLPLEELDPGGVKNHIPGSNDRTNDINACHAGAAQWSCPTGVAGEDDDMEGNSHPFHPGLVDTAVGLALSSLNTTNPLVYSGVNEARVRAGNQVRVVHGGGADCGGDPTPDALCHATVPMDIYYGVVAPPVRKFRQDLIDLVGSAAPYHCEDSCGDPLEVEGP